MNRIFICGDTHGTRNLNKLRNLSANSKLDFDDYVIILGDAGIVWPGLTNEHIDIYEKLNTNILFIDGNHEGFTDLYNYPVEDFCGGKVHKISEHIFHLMRGEVFKICCKTFLALGGADSHDKYMRTEGESWWSEEAVSPLDIANAVDNLKKVDNKVDYVLTHTLNQDFSDKLVEVLTQCGEAVQPFIQEKLDCNESGKLLNELPSIVQFKHWFCGHLHIDETVDKYSVLMERVYEICDNVIKYLYE